MSVAAQKRRFTADDYYRMAETGILGPEDRVELIDGEVVAMTPMGPWHCAAVDRATRALIQAIGDRAIVRVQGAVRLSFYTEPQPDVVLLRPRADFYASGHPGPEDILLIVEVAESSLAYDRDVKSGIYAAAGVREYWIADLTHACLLCLAQPEQTGYQSRVERGRGETVAAQALPDCLLKVSDFLVD